MRNKQKRTKMCRQKRGTRGMKKMRWMAKGKQKRGKEGKKRKTWRRRWVTWSRRRLGLTLRLQAASAAPPAGHGGHSWIYRCSSLRKILMVTSSLKEQAIYHRGNKSTCLTSTAHSSRPGLFTLPPRLSIMWQLSDATAADTLMIHRSASPREWRWTALCGKHSKKT